MKILAIYWKNGKQVIEKVRNQDLTEENTTHIIVIHKYFSQSENGLRCSCAMHLDWCMDELIEKFGKEIFEI